MDILLSPTECRILGSLVEKELTTPDYYPLSLNALLNACNQKSNRQPVLNLAEDEIMTALDRLRHLGFAMQSREGGRVAKFCHTLREKLHLDEEELAILTELLLRGAQTPGEIRARADRMAKLDSLEIVEDILIELIDREVPLATKLPRQKGRKENRYMHLLSGPQELDDESDGTGGQVDQVDTANSQIEEEIAMLRLELDELRLEFNDFKKQFS
jgi:uncharacterized protein YceH (UPF0502 family)